MKGLKIMKKPSKIDENCRPGQGSNPRPLKAVPHSRGAGSIPVRGDNFYRFGGRFFHNFKAFHSNLPNYLR